MEETHDWYPVLDMDNKSAIVRLKDDEDVRLAVGDSMLDYIVPECDVDEKAYLLPDGTRVCYIVDGNMDLESEPSRIVMLPYAAVEMGLSEDPGARVPLFGRVVVCHLDEEGNRLGFTELEANEITDTFDYISPSLIPGLPVTTIEEVNRGATSGRQGIKCHWIHDEKPEWLQRIHDRHGSER